MSKKQLTIFIISCVILLALIGGWVFWYLTRPSLQQDNQPTAETEDQKSKIINLKSEIDTSDWQTYRNEEYRFEVKYPKGWELDEEYKQYNSHNVIAIKKMFTNQNGSTDGSIIKINIYSADKR